MTGTPTDIEATMLLCDYAQAVGGKLYITGGGWSVLLKSQQRASMSLAVKLDVPWSRANERIPIEARLVTANGDAVKNDGDHGLEEVRAAGEVEFGRPPGLPPGSSLDATFVLNFVGLDLSPGTFVWELLVEKQLAARVTFRVIEAGRTP